MLTTPPFVEGVGARSPHLLKATVIQLRTQDSSHQALENGERGLHIEKENKEKSESAFILRAF